VGVKLGLSAAYALVKRSDWGK